MVRKFLHIYIIKSYFIFNTSIIIFKPVGRIEKEVSIGNLLRTLALSFIKIYIKTFISSIQSRLCNSKLL